MINLSKQSIASREKKIFSKVLQSGKITRGKYIEEFEKKVCKYTKSKYAVAVNSASSALFLAYSVFLKKNDIVWTSPVTFISTISGAIHLGSKIDFVDIGKDFNIDPLILQAKLKKTKRKKLPSVVTTVHLRGVPADQDKIAILSKKYNFKVIEDASHSFGASYKNQNVGSCKWSDMTILSFHPSKSITTGEGGMILTNNLFYYRKLLLLRNNGIIKNVKQPWKYKYFSIGHNFWMNEIQAALGISQLNKLNTLISKRKKISKYYDSKLNQTSYFVNSQYVNKSNSYHLYLLKCRNKQTKSRFMEYLKKKGVETTTHYISLHLQPFFKSYKLNKKLLKNSETYTNHYFSIPIYPDLKKKKQDYIIKCILNFK